MPMDAAVDHVQHLLEVARRENPDVIVLAHGGPISGPDDTQELYNRTDAQGFLGASSVERIPVERAVIDTVKALKAKRPRAAAR
jgi:predicted TIM-barrel enzyme